MGDYEREIHFQPKECGNCGQFFVWDEEQGRWIAQCKCEDLYKDE